MIGRCFSCFRRSSARAADGREVNLQAASHQCKFDPGGLNASKRVNSLRASASVLNCFDVAQSVLNNSGSGSAKCVQTVRAHGALPCWLFRTVSPNGRAHAYRKLTSHHSQYFSLSCDRQGGCRLLWCHESCCVRAVRWSNWRVQWPSDLKHRNP